MTTSAHETLWNLIKDIRFGMLVHTSASGHIHAHPLTTQNKEMRDDNMLYFFIPKTGELYGALQTSPEVCVTYAHPGSDSYVSLSGAAGFDDSLALKEQLWSPIVKAWFPDGPTDPNLTVLCVRLHHAQYWDVDESKITQLFKMAKAALTGEEPQLGEHQELRL